MKPYLFTVKSRSELPKTSRRTRIYTVFSILLICILGSVNSFAQKGNIVNGTVIDDKNEPIIGASVMVQGTHNGVASDVDGHFTLTVPANATLEVSYIGYNTVHYPVRGAKTIEIKMEASSTNLNEVVVTALGIKREKKALGYAMQEVKADGLTENRSESVSNMLHGKIAGVQISQSGNDLGGSTRVILRGLTSLSGNNQPLWVVDGTPISDRTGGYETVTEYGYSEYSSGASEINPEDIESISVLKGANAAALYGSRAQNGAIIITTKKGKKDMPITLEYNGNFTFTTAYDAYKLQNVYGQGSNGEFSADAKGSWGPKMEGQIIPNWRNDKYGDSSYAPYAMESQGSQAMDYYRTGSMINNSLAVAGGGKNLTGRFSYLDSRNQGITPGHSLVRQFFDVSGTYSNKYLEVGVKGTYSRQTGINRPDQGHYGIANQFLRMPRNIRLSDLKNPEGLDGTAVNWAGESGEYVNPYVYNYKGNGNKDVKDRIIGQVNASLIFTPWLRLNGKAGIDSYVLKTQIYMPFSYNSTKEQLLTYDQKYHEINSDVLLNFNRTFGDFSVLANAGGAFRREVNEQTKIVTGRFKVPGLVSISNSSNIQTEELLNRKEVHSVLGNVQLGWKNQLFLEATGRNDWSSTLPKTNWSYFYPSISASAVISEMAKLPDFISFLKLRGSWAKVGNDTDPYVLTATYNSWLLYNNAMASTAPTTMPLVDLKPESTKSWELGLDLRMFQNRLGVDFTYYNANTVNQIMNIPVSTSSGYLYKLINAGKISSHGVELMVTGTPIQTKDWDLNLILNWGKNTSFCDELHPDIKRFELGSVSMGTVVVREGEKFGDIVGAAYRRNDKGQVLVNDNGIPVVDTDQVVGNMLPDWTGSVTTNLRFKDFTFGMLIDVRHGGDVLSVTDGIACAAGNSERTLAYREGGLVYPGVNINTGEPNTKSITSQRFYEEVGGRGGVAEEFLYDGSYVKMREMSLGWNLPKAWVNKIYLQNVKLSFVGRDLFFFHKNTPGNPEGSNSRADWAQAFEISEMPPTRSFGFNINVKF